jgi:tetratricopeptide (TPR) repeat protein
VLINTVGIGSPEGSPIEDPVTGELHKDQDGHTVMSKLNEAEMQQLATETNGSYLRLDNVEDALITMTQQLDVAEKKAMNDSEFIDYISYFQWFAGVALVLLLVELLLAERRRGRLAARGGLLLLLATLGLLMTGSASAQTTNTLIRSGNRAYKKKQIDQSIRQYQAAVDKAPNNATANYNLGNAQFRKNEYDAAARSYDASAGHSATDKPMEEKSLYNKGVAMAKQKKLQESIDAWKAALKLDAADSAARENLEKALMEQKQQQQQQNQQKKNQDQKKEQKDKKKQDQQQQQQQPKPQPSRLNKQQVEQLLKALQQRENDLQNKLNQNKVHSLNQPDKDW